MKQEKRIACIVKAPYKKSYKAPVAKRMNMTEDDSCLYISALHQKGRYLFDSMMLRKWLYAYFPEI
jgi:hypothetical protein